MIATAMAMATTDVPPPLCWKLKHEENKERRRQELNNDGVRRADDIATECRNRLVDSVRAIASSADDSSKLGLLLSGGVDSCAILHAAASVGVEFAAAVTVAIVDPAECTPPRRPPEDELYAAEAVRVHNARSSAPDMEHRIVRLSPAQLTERYSRPTIKTLALWGFMDTRNSLIIGAALHEASKLGLTDVVVGDNADELFGGSYDVFFNEKYAEDPEGWKEKRDGMAQLPFVTQDLATYYSLRVHQPFMDQDLVRWAIEETTRNDCIARCSVKNQWGRPFELQSCGKALLREAFCTVASWRRMDWIFRGSGAAEGNILVGHYETSVGISDDNFRSQRADYLRRGIVLKSKEHLHNIRIFQSVFGGLVHPTKQRYPIGDRRGCVSCCFEIGNEQFCHLCDEYPAQHPKK